jgi:hypothetical protein
MLNSNVIYYLYEDCYQMSRKKPIKKAKTMLSKTKVSTKLKSTGTEVLENQLKGFLAKLPQQCRKDLSAVKQQVVKLTAALKKAKAQKKSANIAKLTAQLEQSKKQVVSLSQKKAKFSELNKMITGFLKQSIAPVVKKKPKKTKLASKTKRDTTTTADVRYEAPKTVTETTPEFEFENA